MKTEITLENKNRFILQHMNNGAPFVLIDESYYDTSSPYESIGHGIKRKGFEFIFDWKITVNAFRYGNGNFPNKFIQKSAVILKSLESLTDEDAREVAKIAGWDVCSGKDLNIAYCLEHYEKTIDLENFHIIDHSYVRDFETYEPIDNVVHVIDYLRSKGYALPWMGLTVQEMIDAEWIILK